jgi:hypothetical protein
LNGHVLKLTGYVISGITLSLLFNHRKTYFFVLILIDVNRTIDATTLKIFNFHISIQSFSFPLYKLYIITGDDIISFLFERFHNKTPTSGGNVLILCLANTNRMKKREEKKKKKKNSLKNEPQRNRTNIFFY